MRTPSSLFSSAILILFSLTALSAQAKTVTCSGKITGGDLPASTLTFEDSGIEAKNYFSSPFGYNVDVISEPNGAITISLSKTRNYGTVISSVARGDGHFGVELTDFAEIYFKVSCQTNK